MPKFDTTNRGVLFKNKRRQNDKHPEYTGTINVNGEEFRLAAWVKTSRKDGQKFFSLSVDVGEQQPTVPQDWQPRPKPHEDRSRSQKVSSLLASRRNRIGNK